MKFGILMTEKSHHVAFFWVMTLDILVGVTSILEQHTASIFREENGGSVFLQNIGNHMPSYIFSTQKTVP
jgi:hypothetical protein